MKPNRFLIAAVFTLLTVMAAQAQWAGEDKYILKGQAAHIGKVEPGSIACYVWTGPNITSDIHQAVVTVEPTTDSAVYTVRKIDSCGVWEDQVVVYVKDSVSIVRITPKACYSDGDSLKLEDFIIVTVPSGYANQVKIYPKIASISNGLLDAIGHGESPLQGLSQHGTMEVTFSLTHGYHTSTKKVEINVYKDEPVTTPTIGVTVSEIYKLYERIKACAQLAKELGRPFELIAPPNVTPCTPKYSDWNADIDIPIPVPIISCCDGKAVEGVNITGPTTTFTIGLDCDFPTAGSIPIPFCKSGIFLTAGIQGGFTLKAFDIKFRGWDCSRLEFPLEFFLEGFGGGKAMAGNDSILSLAIKFVVHGGISFSAIIDKTGLKWGLPKGIPIDFSLLLEAKLHGFIPIKIPIPLGTITIRWDQNGRIYVE